CANGTTIDEHFDVSRDLTHCVGALVLVDQTSDRGVHLHWLTQASSSNLGGRLAVPTWVERHLDELDDPDLRVRNEAEIALSRMSPNDLDGIFGLIKAQNHKAFRVRAVAGVILNRLAPNAVDALIHLYRIPSLGVERKHIEAALSHA